MRRHRGYSFPVLIILSGSASERLHVWYGKPGPEHYIVTPGRDSG
jgi:hypothetical protein